jgi:hypothetical protein
MIFRLVPILACCLCTSLASDVTLRVEFPDRVVISKPQTEKKSGEFYQTSLQLAFVVQNNTTSGLKLTTLNGDDGPKLLYPLVTARLFDPMGKELGGGYVAGENFAGSSARKDTLLPPGKSIRLPYYRPEPFEQITVAGTYTLKVSARFRDEKDTWHPSEAKPVTFVVEFEK